MYIYTIYKNSSTGDVVIKYIVNEANETIAEANARAQATLESLKSESEDPDSIKMKRRLVPSI